MTNDEREQLKDAIARRLADLPCAPGDQADFFDDDFGPDSIASVTAIVTNHEADGRPFWSLYRAQGKHGQPIQVNTIGLTFEVIDYLARLAGIRRPEA
jgi:hypothetical protein